jgi:quercetin dioxygenase-like cupin family protein
MQHPGRTDPVKIISYSDVRATHFDNDKAKGVAGRVVIGKNDGAGNFCMRIFEIAAGGNTPKHSHDWEHEIFFHAGAGEVYSNGKWSPVKAGSVAFIPANEEHQIRNSGRELLVFACLIPSTAPEL